MDIIQAVSTSVIPLTDAFRQERFCRLCLGSGQAGRLQRFFQAESGCFSAVNPDLLEEIRSLVGIELNSHDDRQSAICSRCVRSLEDFFYFRNRCQAVDVRVREMRAGKFPGPSSSPPQPSPPAKHKDKEPDRDRLGIFGSAEFCRDPADEPDVFRLAREGFVYQHRNLFDWRCEVVGCGCRLDVDKDLRDWQVLEEHDHEVAAGDGREVFKINPAVRAFLDGLPKVGWSTDLVLCSTAAESVLNIVEYPQDDEPERVPEAPFSNAEVANCTPEPDVSFFNCFDRGLSMVRGGFHFLLIQIRSAGGSTWLCTWSSCQVTLEADSQLTSFKTSSEHSHPAPDPSVLLETTGVPVTQDRVFAEISASPCNDGQNPHPEVTFYRVAKSVIGVRHDGFYFHLVGFNPAGDSLWSCTWNGCQTQLEVSGKLNCRLVSGGSSGEWATHDHQRPDGPLCSVANIISPVKALVELNGKRCVMGRKENQQNGMEILEGMPQMQLKLTKVLPDSFKNPLPPTSTLGHSFKRCKRILCLVRDERYFLPTRYYYTTGNSEWQCAAHNPMTREKCPVTVQLDVNLKLVSTRNDHNHRLYQRVPMELQNGKPISPQDVAAVLKGRRRRKGGFLRFFQKTSGSVSSVNSSWSEGSELLPNSSS